MLEIIKGIIFKVAIYIRLSKEDVDKGYDESESIINQRTLLTQYVEKLGENYELVDIYIDPGYTGTNFKRPEFQRMKRDIEQGKVNMVITKDLSRLGRDYIETGEYIEKWFPEYNVRYISVTDGVDTFKNDNGNNDIIPFKSILNDMYSKDLSKKIRTSLHTMQKEGKWVGGKVALGYMKSPQDKNKLIINESEAEIVRTIFNMAYSGKELHDIKDYLVNNNIPTANQMRYNKQTFWENRAIKNILKNPIYIGTTIQNKNSRINYKNRKLRPNPKEQWHIVENTHEPIISKEVFEVVQKMAVTQKYGRNEKKHQFLLDGLLICYECKHKIGVRARPNGQLSMVCNNYRRNSKLKICTSHGFSYEELEKTVIQYIKQLFTNINKGEIELSIKNSKNKSDYTAMLKAIQLEINKINSNIDKMYLDKLNGKISEEMYERVYNDLNNKMKQEKDKYDALYKEKEDIQEDNTDKIKKIISDTLKLEKPTKELLRVLINRIEIHQDKQIDIVFNFRKLNEIKKQCLF